MPNIAPDFSDVTSGSSAPLVSKPLPVSAGGWGLDLSQPAPQQQPTAADRDAAAGSAFAGALSWFGGMISSVFPLVGVAQDAAARYIASDPKGVQYLGQAINTTTSGDVIGGSAELEYAADHYAHGAIIPTVDSAVAAADKATAGLQGIGGFIMKHPGWVVAALAAVVALPALVEGAALARRA